MEPCNQARLFLIGTLFVALTGMSGCDSTGRERSDAARTSLQTMDNDIQSAIRQLGDTGRSLENLMGVSQNDLDKSFDAFAMNVSQLETLEKKFSRHASEMTSRGTDYFEEWQKEGDQYRNPEIQKLSEQRRAALGKSYDEIAERSAGLDEAFKTHVSDLAEIQTFLSNDLTADGISAIMPTSRRVLREGDSLRVALGHVQVAVRNAREGLSQNRTGDR